MIRDQGKTAAQADAGGRNYNGKQAEYDAMVKKSVDENEKGIDAFIKLRDTIQKVDAILDSSITKFIGGGIIAAFSITLMAASGQLGRLAAAAIAAAKALTGIGVGNGNLPDINGDTEGKGKGKGKGGKGGKGGWKGKVGMFGKLGGAAVGVGMAGYEAYNAYDDYEEGKTTDTERNAGYGSAIGGGVGGIAGGAAAGAAVGMLGGPLAPVTVPIAALIGGGLGYWGGSAVGEKIGGITGTGTKKGAPPPQQQTPTKSIVAGLAQTDLGNAVAKAESGKAGYGAFNRNRAGDARGASLDFSQMSINEVLRRQSLPSSDPDKLLAVGRYQFIRPTLLEGVNALKLDKNMPFTNEVQDQLFQWDAMKKRKMLGDYLNGSVEDNDANRAAALKDLSSEWMAFATPGSTSAATSVAGNKASVMNADALQMLQRSQQQLASGGFSSAVPTPNLQQLQQMQSIPSMGGIQSAQAIKNYNSMVGGSTPPLPPNSDVSVISGKGGPQAMELDELRKQTQLLAQVAQNTAGKGSIARPNDSMYKRPPSEVANNMAS